MKIKPLQFERDQQEVWRAESLNRWYNVIPNYYENDNIPQGQRRYLLIYSTHRSARHDLQILEFIDVSETTAAAGIIGKYKTLEEAIDAAQVHHHRYVAPFLLPETEEEAVYLEDSF